MPKFYLPFLPVQGIVPEPSIFVMGGSSSKLEPAKF